MVITNRTYKKKYDIGDAGIFDSIENFFARIFSRNAAKQFESDIGMKAIDVGKTVAIDACKKLFEKAAKN